MKILKSIVAYYLLLCTLFACFTACRLDKKTDNKNTEIQLSGIHKVVLLDSLSAAKTIVKDDIDKFFEKITPVDMMIQMHKSYPQNSAQEAVLADYKKFIQTDVLDFTPAESAFLAKIMVEAFSLCNQVAPNIFPEEIRLIKTHGKHYGSDTYYTRENVIVIPKQAFVQANSDVFLKVILHEISHIVTRLHPTTKAKLYATIGFKKMDNPLIIKDSLKQRLLTNPDGSDLNWATELTAANGKNVFTIPLIYANDSTYHKEKPEFFNYLGWNYYEIAPSVSGKEFVVQTIGKQQKSTLNTQGLNTLFKNKFNTEYIIHPDEIVADNFSILMYSMKNPKSLEPLSAGGKQLIETMKTVLK